MLLESDLSKAAVTYGNPLLLLEEPLAGSSSGQQEKAGNHEAERALIPFDPSV